MKAINLYCDLCVRCIYANTMIVCQCHFNIPVNTWLYIPQPKPMAVSPGPLPSLFIGWDWLEPTFLPGGVLPKRISILKWTRTIKIGK